MKKTFVIDANVAFHDSAFLRSFEEHNLILPMAVIDQLDGHRKGPSTLNHHARETLKAVDKLSTKEMFNGGASLGEGLGKLRVRRFTGFDEDVKERYPKDTSHDIQILNLCYQLREENVILVTKKVSLRIKAQDMGLRAEDYTTDQTPLLLRDDPIIEEVPKSVIDDIFAGKKPDVAMDGYTILKPNDGGSGSCLAYQGRAIHSQTISGITPKNAQQTFSVDGLMDEDLPLMALTGKAGTGKTLLALAAAIAQRRAYRQILLVRPVVSMGEIGFLPGDINSKIGPYMQPLFDNLKVIKEHVHEKDRDLIDKMLEDEKIVIEPLPYIRGRSLYKIFMIVDESQNLTPHEVKTIVTRAGENAKIIFTGDIHQIDHEYLDERTNGLSYLIDKMHKSDLFRHVNLIHGLRSPLAKVAIDLL